MNVNERIHYCDNGWNKLSMKTLYSDIFTTLPLDDNDNRLNTDNQAKLK